MTAYDFYRIAPPGVGLIGIHLYESRAGTTTPTEKVWNG
jgi:hypothetical protein